MTAHRVRAYADTSVFGGAADAEFVGASRRFLAACREGRAQLVVSALVEGELEDAPAPVRRVFERMLDHAEVVEIDARAIALQAAYLDHGVVTERWATDALHVAVASVARCAAIVSWNFRHIVNFRRIPLYNGVNALMGYGPIAIHSPPEVPFDAEEP